MNNSDFFSNSSFGDDWDDKDGEILWTEKEWQSTISRSNENSQRFASLYKSLKRTTQTFFPILTNDLEFANEYFKELQNSIDITEEDYKEILFAQPSYIVFRGLFFQIYDTWEDFIRSYDQPLSGTVVSVLLNILKEAEIQCISMLQGIELGEVGLVTVCAKRAFFLINKIFDCLRVMRSHTKKEESLDKVCDFIESVVFDIRENILKVKNFAEKSE